MALSKIWDVEWIYQRLETWLEVTAKDLKMNLDLSKKKKMGLDL